MCFFPFQVETAFVIRAIFVVVGNLLRKPVGNIYLYMFFFLFRYSILKKVQLYFELVLMLSKLRSSVLRR